MGRGCIEGGLEKYAENGERGEEQDEEEEVEASDASALLSSNQNQATRYEDSVVLRSFVHFSENATVILDMLQRMLIFLVLVSVFVNIIFAGSPNTSDQYVLPPFSSSVPSTSSTPTFTFDHGLHTEWNWANDDIGDVQGAFNANGSSKISVKYSSTSTAGFPTHTYGLTSAQPGLSPFSSPYPTSSSSAIPISVAMAIGEPIPARNGSTTEEITSLYLKNNSLVDAAALSCGV